MIGVPMVEPEPRASLADAVVRLGGSRRLFLDMPSDPRLASCEPEELRLRFRRLATLTSLSTLPLNGHLSRPPQLATLFSSAFVAYVLPHSVAPPPSAAAL